MSDDRKKLEQLSADFPITPKLTPEVLKEIEEEGRAWSKEFRERTRSMEGPPDPCERLRSEVERLTRERDDWRTKAMDVEKHPVIVELKSELRAAHAEAAALREALERCEVVMREHDMTPIQCGYGFPVTLDLIGRALDASPSQEPPAPAPAELEGLHRKYRVTKNDGTPVDDLADYFVLRLDTDPRARHAARTYARDIESENPQLADDLRRRCDRYALAELDRVTGRKP